MTDRCEIAKCRAEADARYLGHAVCFRHWNELTNENALPDALRMALGIEAGPEPLTEDTPMSSKKKAETKNEKTETKAKAEKSKKSEPKVDKEKLRTLALRVTNEEFDRVHAAAGPRNVSAFMKSAILGQASKVLSK